MSTRRLVFWTALGYLLFVIYGSLVPLDFHPRPLGEAWSAFRNIRHLQLGVGDRADWVANVLLFIPLSFLWLSSVVRDRGAIGQFLLGLWVIALCAVLSVTIEFVQIFSPPRTVSLNDIVAESMGAVIGVIAWFLVGRKVEGFVSVRAASPRKGGIAGTADRVLKIYLCVLFFYNLMPFDLTLSAAEIYHKWQAGRVVLVPFGFRFSSAMQMIYGMGTDILIWVPMPILLVLVGKPPLRAWLVTVGCASLIEFLQLFVYTRVSDVTQILLAGIGAAVGVWMGTGALRKGRPPGAAPQPQRRTSYLATGPFLGWLACALAWIVILALVFWYPFNFNLERRFVMERIHRLTHSVPFQAYYYGSEYRALTEVLHKVLFFAPLGITLALAARSVRSAGWRVVAAFLAAMIAGAVAFGIDAGRLLLPEKSPDIADWFLQFLGALVGYWVTYKFGMAGSKVQDEVLS